jgi:hypothetical protein
MTSRMNLEGRTDARRARRHPTNLKGVAGGIAVGAFLLGLSGCQSARGVGGHASVQIPGQPIETIRLTTKDVFSRAGYGLRLSLPDSMIFDKLGHSGDALLYGGWNGEGVVTRVKVDFAALGADQWRLVATVYVVRDAADLLMEEESRKLLLNRGPYQRLLADVKRNVETGEEAPHAAQ